MLNRFRLWVPSVAFICLAWLLCLPLLHAKPSPAPAPAAHSLVVTSPFAFSGRSNGESTTPEFTVYIRCDYTPYTTVVPFGGDDYDYGVSPPLYSGGLALYLDGNAYMQAPNGNYIYAPFHPAAFANGVIRVRRHSDGTCDIRATGQVAATAFDQALHDQINASTVGYSAGWADQTDDANNRIYRVILIPDHLVVEGSAEEAAYLATLGVSF